jgi:cell division protein FtsB
VNTEPKQGITSTARRVVTMLYGMRRRIATGFAAVLTVFFAYHVMFGRNGVNSYEQKRAQYKQLHQQIDSLQQENDQLQDHVSRLKSDPDAIEYEAREKLHYARPGEVIYTLNNQPATAGDKQQAPAAPATGSPN